MRRVKLGTHSIIEGNDEHLISFVIPVLNGEKFIGPCLEHIQAEMKDLDEIIVVDNGSTDSTLTIVRGFAHVKLLEFPGVSIAALRNRGSEIAEGNLLAFIDADCMVCEGWRDAVERVMSNPEVKATGSFYDIPTQTTWIERAWWSLRRTTETETNFLLSGNLVIRVEVFKAVSGFNEKLVTDEDTDISIRLTEMGAVMIDSPGVRVVHLGNAKTLRQFARKAKWHATSILDTMAAHKMDKPMLLTLAFILCIALATLATLFSVLGLLHPLVVVGLILFAPGAAATHRVVVYGKFRYFPHLLPLFFIIYAMRSITLVELLLSRLQSQPSAP